MRRSHALDALGALLVVGWAVAWTYGILHRYFDHDELEHLYAAWRIGRGDRPIYDFFQDHPPFLWYALAPALPLLGRISFPLFPLRFLTAAGHLVFLIALGKNVSLSLARLPRPELPSRRLFVIAALVFAGHLSVIWYLLEFRLDAWPNALLFLAIHRYRRETDRPFRAPSCWRSLRASRSSARRSSPRSSCSSARSAWPPVQSGCDGYRDWPPARSRPGS